MIDLLVVAAHPVELSPLEELLAGRSNGPTVEVRAVGVGLVEAGIGTANALAQIKTRAILLVGSVGVFPGKNLPTEGLVLATGTRLVSDGALARRTEFPAAMVTERSFDPRLVESLRQALPEARTRRVATALGITVASEVATQMAQTGEEYENLEAIAVASAARLRGVPIAALFGVTNEVGPKGRGQWLRNHSRVALEVAQGVHRWLGASNKPVSFN